MSDSFGSPVAAMRGLVGSAVFALVIVAFVVGAVAPREAWAQANAPAVTAPPPSSPPPAAVPPAPRGENPGLINEIGKLWDKSSSMLPSLLPGNDAPAAAPQDAPGTPLPSPPAARPGAAAPSAPAIAAPPAGPGAPAPGLVPSMVSGRMPCPAAGNGAPDCKAGADRLCQSKGFRDGKSLSSDSVEECSAKRLIPGRERKPDDCRTAYFVTRAFCQ